LNDSISGTRMETSCCNDISCFNPSKSLAEIERERGHLGPQRSAVVDLRRFAGRLHGRMPNQRSRYGEYFRSCLCITTKRGHLRCMIVHSSPCPALSSARPFAKLLQRCFDKSHRAVGNCRCCCSKAAVGYGSRMRNTKPRNSPSFHNLSSSATLRLAGSSAKARQRSPRRRLLAR
jgi:hypothetical protein